MTLPLSGQITLSQVDVELSRASNAQVSLGETAVRNLAGVSTGQISLASLYGKAAFSPTNPLPSSGGSYSDTIDGQDDVTITVGSDGSLTIIGTSTGYFLNSSWGTPVSAGVGASYWVKFTLTSGAASGNDAPTITSLSSSKKCWVESIGTISGAGPTRTGTFRVDIYSDAGGANLVASGSYTISAHGLQVF